MKATRWVAAFGTVWVALAGLSPVGFSAKVSEATFEEMLPEDTVLYVSVPDAAKLAAKFKESNAYKILREIDPIKLMSGAPEFDRVKQLYLTYVQPLTHVFHKRISLAVRDIPCSPRVPAVFFLADVAEKEPALRQYLTERLHPLLKQKGAQITSFTHGGYEVQQISPPLPFEVCYTIADGVFIATVGKQPMQELLDQPKRERSLAKSEVFQEVRQKVGEKSDFLVYGSVSALLEDLAPIIPPEARAVLEASGLSGVKAVGVGGEWRGPASRDGFYIATGTERKGFVKLFAQKATPLKAAGYLPENMTFFYDLSLGDFGEFWDGLLGAIRGVVVSVGGARDWEQVVAKLRWVEQKLGFRIKEDIFSPFAGEVCIAAKVPEVWGVPAVFVMLEVKDPQKAEALIQKLIALLEKAGLKVLKTEERYKDVGVFSLSLLPSGMEGAGDRGMSFVGMMVFPFLRPSYAIVGDFLVVGIHSGSVKRVVDVYRGEKSLKQNPEFQRVFANLSEKGSIAMYVNLREIYDFLYGTFGAIAARQIGSDIVARLGRIAPYFGSIGARLSCDEKGMLSESFSDSGGAEHILVQMAIMRFVSMRTRPEGGKADVAQCMANVRKLAVGCIMFANDHDDTLPARLSELYPDYVASLETFVCPADKEKVISKERIDTESDYGLRLRGRKLTDIKDPAKTLMLSEKMSNHGRLMNAAFADGHVERAALEPETPAPLEVAPTGRKPE